MKRVHLLYASGLFAIAAAIVLRSPAPVVAQEGGDVNYQIMRGMQIVDAQGRPRIQIDMDGVRLFNAKGESIGGMAELQTGDAMVGVWTPNGKRNAFIGTSGGKGAGFTAYDEGKQLQAQLFVDEGRAGMKMTEGPKCSGKVLIGLLPGGNAIIALKKNGGMNETPSWGVTN